MPDNTPPEKLGRYKIIGELGKGAMGVVYEGEDPNIGRRVAIKTARRDVMEASGMGEEILKRFLREAQAAGKLNHPNIITIYDAGEEDDIAYIAMEFVEGGDLCDLIEDRRKLDPKEIAGIGATICDALSAAHEHGIVHRDIKPANILTPKDGPLKLADFGIAHVTDSTLTQEGALIGTPHYMSPEQFMGQKLDGRSDLFSVAVILYELLTGEKPFTGEALSTVMHHVIRVDPTAPEELNYLVPRNLSTVVLKAMAKRPDERYQKASAMAAALRESVKTNPDMAIIRGEQPGAQIPDDATVQLNRAESPTAVTAAGADPTVSGGCDATVASEPPADVDEGTPKPHARIKDVPVAQPPAPDGLTPASDRLTKNWLAIAGFIIVAGLGVGGAWLMSHRETDPVPAGALEQAANAPEALVEMERYYSRAYLELLEAQDQATYEAWLDGADAEALDPPPRMITGGATIKLFQEGESAPFKVVPDYASGDLIEWETPAGSFYYTVEHLGEEVFRSDLMPQPAKPEAAYRGIQVLEPLE